MARETAEAKPAEAAIVAAAGVTDGRVSEVRCMQRNARLLAGAVVALLFAGGTLFAWFSHHRTWDAAERRMVNLAERHAVLLSFLLDGVDGALQDLRVAPAGAGESSGLNRPARSLPQVDAFPLDAAGRPLRRDRDWDRLLPPAEDLSRLLSRAAAAPGRTVFATPQVVGDEIWSLGLVRLPGGEPPYLAAPFRVDQVIGLWRDLHRLDGALIGIIGDDDRLWLRHPHDIDRLGLDLLALPPLQQARRAGERDGLERLRYPSTLGVERLYAWQLVGQREMMVVAGIPVAAIRLLWLERLLPVLLLTLVLAAAAILAVWIYSRSVLAQALQRESALRALAASEARFRDFADASSDWYWESDAEHRVIWLSDRISEVLNVPAASLLGKKRSALIGGVLDGEHQRRHLADLEARRSFRDFVYQIRLNDGRLRWIKVSGKPVFGAAGRFLGYRGAGRDIDAQRKVEERVEVLHRRLVEAFEASLDGIALFDSEDHLILANERYKEFFFPGHEEQVQPGLHFNEMAERITRVGRRPLVTREDDEWRALRERRGTGDQEVIFELSDGRWMRLRERVTARGDYFRVFSDVTEFKRREDELRHIKEAAELANRAKSEFLAVMSHELRTPLNAIIGFSDILRGEMFGPLGGRRYRDYAGDINQSGRHLLEVINDILDISKAEAGKLELQEEEVSLEELAERAIAMIVPRAQEAGVRLSSTLPPEPVRLHADRRKLLQMLLNLLSNAVKFTPPGGRVSVVAGVGCDGVELAVEDSGIGIAPQDLGRVQEPFIQLDSAMTRQREGTGLGLPLAKRLAELHGGTLQIESEQGRGTRVCVRLPLARLVPAVAGEVWDEGRSPPRGH